MIRGTLRPIQIQIPIHLSTPTLQNNIARPRIHACIHNPSSLPLHPTNPLIFATCSSKNTLLSSHRHTYLTDTALLESKIGEFPRDEGTRTRAFLYARENLTHQSHTLHTV